MTRSFHPTFPIQAGRWVNLKYWLRKLWGRLSCSHTHTFTAELPPVTWYSSGEAKGRRNGILIRGCYLCGTVEVFDYKA